MAQKVAGIEDTLKTLPSFVFNPIKINILGFQT